LLRYEDRDRSDNGRDERQKSILHTRPPSK
jgi:hypothetical protein